VGKTTGFKEFERRPPAKRPVGERVGDYLELYQEWPPESVQEQGARCMDCGVPFCHQGCPLGNLIPEWNDLVYRGQWEVALHRLLATNNFPEFTGRICPAPCEVSCTLAINDDPVTIEFIEKAISDRGYEEGWIKPQLPPQRTGKKVAVVGSGPAGLACAQQLNRAGHLVTVYERDQLIGGLLRLGIPDFKLSKDLVQKRIDIMAAEGIEFVTGAFVGKNVPTDDLVGNFDAIALCSGSTFPRDLEVPGRNLDGIHYAMEYLPQQNYRGAGMPVHASGLNAAADPPPAITAEGKRVIIIGGGDTGADCLGTTHRQGAASVHQFELLPEPPEARAPDNPWPQWSRVLRLSPAHEEGGELDFAIETTQFTGSKGQVEQLHAHRLNWTPGENGRMKMEPIPDTDFTIDCDLVLLAMGFLHPEHDGPVRQLGLELDGRGNVKVDRFKRTSREGIFAAGDMARGQSLVVWAIAEGRAAAHGVDKYLMGRTTLPFVRT